MTTTDLIKSYPYIQFADDINIVAWFDAFNTYAQEYLDWFNDTPLAIYTNDTISGPLLDWVANGVYGIYRIPISNGNIRSIGPLNTYTLNQIALNQGKTTDTGTAQVMTDDIFKRVITWDFYKGDGMQFTIPWFKRRIARFLYGIGGFENTFTISVTIPSAKTLDVTITDNASVIATAEFLSQILNTGIVNFPIGWTVTFSYVTTT